MTPVLTVPPAGEPVSLDEAKAWLRLDTADEDALVSALIIAARQTIEAHTRRFLMTQTVRLEADCWPAGKGTDPFATSLLVPLMLAPVASVSAIRVFDAAGSPQSVDSGTWQLFGAPEQAELLFSTAPPAPGRLAAGIAIDVVVGYGAASDVPQPLRTAILMLVARAYENRGDADATMRVVPTGVAALVAPFRRARLA